MKAIATAAIKPGMVLARDIVDQNGRVILAAGAVLTDAHREMLLRRSIAAATIQEATAAAPAQGEDKTTAAEEKQRARLADIDHMFADYADDLRMQELKRIAIRQALRDDDHA